MSFGSLSTSAIKVLNIGAQEGNFTHNTDEFRQSASSAGRAARFVCTAWRSSSAFAFGHVEHPESGTPRLTREGSLLLERDGA